MLIFIWRMKFVMKVGKELPGFASSLIGGIMQQWND